MKEILCSVCGAVGAAIATAFGGWSDGLTTLIIFMSVDYVTGLLLAVMGKSKNTETGHLSSGACWRGLVKKGVCLLIVLVGCRLDLLSGTTYIRDATVVAFCVSEVISILENASLMGVPIPAVITNAIDLLKNNESVEIKTEPDQDGGV